VRTHRSRSGVTLVELMISYALIAFLIAAVSWALIVCFRVNRVVEAELDLVHTSMRIMASVSGEAALSRGLVRFVPKGQTAPKDGLLVRGNRILVFELASGELVKYTYRSDDYQLVSDEILGSGFTYFHLVELEKGLHISMQLAGDARTQYASNLPWTVDLSTAVRARHW
jgi:hypothetical protein